jgi:hypothetical protein
LALATALTVPRQSLVPTPTGYTDGAVHRQFAPDGDATATAAPVNARSAGRPTGEGAPSETLDGGRRTTTPVDRPQSSSAYGAAPASGASLVWAPTAGTGGTPAGLPSQTVQFTAWPAGEATVSQRRDEPSRSTSAPRSGVSTGELTYRTPASTTPREATPPESAGTPASDTGAERVPVAGRVPAPGSDSSPPSVPETGSVSSVAGAPEAAPFTEFPDTQTAVDHLYEAFQRRYRVDRERRGL